MKVAIVRLADITAEPGHMLNARYWCNRVGSESYAAYKSRTEVERIEQAITGLHQRITQLRGHQAQLVELDTLDEVTSYIRKIRRTSRDLEA